jgi:hypothetical protein
MSYRSLYAISVITETGPERALGAQWPIYSGVCMKLARLIEQDGKRPAVSPAMSTGAPMPASLGESLEIRGSLSEDSSVTVNGAVLALLRR